MRVQCNYRVCSVYDLVDVHAPVRKLERLAQRLWSALSRYWSVSDVVPLHSKLTWGVPTGRHGMTIRTILPTKDPLSGFWAASERNGYEVRLVWAMASEALARIFALTPAEVRDFLDSPAGRLLADDISFVEGGPTSAEAIEALIKSRLGHLGWRRLYEQVISETRAQKRAPRDPRWNHSNPSSRRMRPAHGKSD